MTSPDETRSGDLLDLAVPYALHALSDSERDDVETRLADAGLPVADAFYDEVRAVRETMAVVSAASAAEPPADLRGRLLARVEGDNVRSLPARPAARPRGFAYLCECVCVCAYSKNRSHLGKKNKHNMVACACAWRVSPHPPPPRTSVRCTARCGLASAARRNRPLLVHPHRAEVEREPLQLRATMGHLPRLAPAPSLGLVVVPAVLGPIH